MVDLVGTAIGELLDGTSGADRIDGAGGNDTIVGGEGNDVLIGGAGDDVFRFAARFYGRDTIEDFSIGDKIELSALFVADLITLSPYMFDVTGGVEIRTFASTTPEIIFIKNVTLSQLTSDRFVFNTSPNRLLLNGSIFNDVLFGGNGNDTITGFGGNDEYNGGAGNDSLRGSSEIDIMRGGVGNDTLNGRGGADILNGGADFDFASYANAAAGLTLFMSGGTFNTGDANGDTHISIEGLIGSDFSDIIGGDANINELQGLGGNDFIYGRAGNDTLTGGEGNDVLSGGLDGDRLDGSVGIDVAFYRDAAVGLTASLLSGGTAGEAMGDTYLNIENIWGSDFDDVLTGDNGGGQVYGFAGNDNLSGLDGDDFFYGSVGLDTMTGGNGVDNFFFLSWNDHFNQFGTLEAYEGGDTFTDFTVGTDRIILSRYWFGFGNIQGPAAALTDTHANFVTNGTPTSARPSLIWNAGNRTLSFDADGNGATQAVLLGTFQGSSQLALGDIWTA